MICAPKIFCASFCLPISEMEMYTYTVAGLLDSETIEITCRVVKVRPQRGKILLLFQELAKEGSIRYGHA